MASLLSTLISPKHNQAVDIPNSRKVQLCSVEKFDDDAELTPVRRSRKKEIHKNHALVQECRKLKSEGLSMDQIAIVSGIEPTSIEKWNRKGWLEQQIRRRRSAVL